MTLSIDKEFIPGTLGWTAADLDDPQIESLWEQDAYEIVDGVLTIMPAAYFDRGETLATLIHVIKRYQEAGGLPGRFSVEVDLVLASDRVARADGAMLTPADSRKQREAAHRERRRDLRRTRILVPPTLVIEVVSPGHEAHDEATKRRWYTEAGIPHYWILDCFKRTMASFILDGREYRAEFMVEGDSELTPSLFPGLVLNLAEVWPQPDPEDQVGENAG